MNHPQNRLCPQARHMLKAGLWLAGIFSLYILATLWNTSDIGSYGCFLKKITKLLETAFLVGLIPAYGAAVIELIKK